AAPLMRKLNPFHRKNKPPVAYWSGLVEVQGEHRFTYRVPDDFNGTLRVMAVAVAPQRIGTWQGKVTVRGDFVLSPNAPTVLSPGDEAVVGVGVANNLPGLAAPVPITVTLQTGEGVTVIGDARQTVTLGAMKEGRVTFRVKATRTLGATDLR
ncbi:alpha-2-macroglobulin family protein, partial [Acinetobacter baumannii]|uniref:alpha-2-macroglobulin family protein n=1 Tax=Acinetobacter baumannii TaxID=470 RepID=UPI00189AD508